jgi:hypothetical protein
MPDLSRLLDNNRRWAERMERERPGFFQSLKAQQKPRYLWIGCADSRVPANEIIDLPPGEVFVHRNVANLVVHSDLNCLAVLDFAVNVLKVEDSVTTATGILGWFILFSVVYLVITALMISILLRMARKRRQRIAAGGIE